MGYNFNARGDVKLVSFFLVSYQKHVLALNIIFNVNSRIARTNISYADKNAGMLAHGFFYFCIWRHRESVISLLFGTILTGFKDKHCCGCHKASRGLLLHTRWIQMEKPLDGVAKGGLETPLSRRSFAQITPRNCLKVMFTPNLPNHAGWQIDLSRNNAIFIQIHVFTLWNMTDNAITLSTKVVCIFLNPILVGLFHVR